MTVAEIPGRAAIAAGHPLSAAVGAGILEAGGNAFDAAVAVAFLQGVVDPAKCGIGGWGVAVCRAGGAAPVAIDFPAVAGSLARPDQWADRIEREPYHGYLPVLRGRVNDVGHGAIGVPSAVAGFGEIHRRFGRLAWGRLLEPAIRAARHGVVVVDGVLGAGAPEWDWPGAVPLARRLAVTAAGRALYLRGHSTYRVGDRLLQPELAATLEEIAMDGADALYRGPLGERIAADLAANGATVTATDLADYRPRVELALEAPLAGHQLWGTWPPESGISIAQAAIALDGALAVAAGPLAPDNVARVAAALDLVVADRARELGDPRRRPVDVEGMLARARDWARPDGIGPHAGPRSAAGGGPAHTTSVVIVDAAGDSVAMNHSLAGSAGSGVVTAGLGFLYNNAMAGFDARPGGPNEIVPGTARWSAACPTIACSADAGVLAVTGPGGSRAMAAVLQVLLDLMVFELDPARAVELPRFDAHDGVVDVEPDLPAGARAAIERSGRRITTLPGAHIAAVYAARRDASGALDAAADPRWPGSSQVA